MKTVRSHKTLSASAVILSILTAAAARGQTLYWTDGSGAQSTLYRATPGDGEPRPVVKGVDTVSGLAVDPLHKKIYWLTRSSEGHLEIRRANVDGTEVETVSTALRDGAGDLAILPAAETLFWANWKTNTIHRANADGTGVQTIVADHQVLAGGIAVDPEEHQLYWLGYPHVQRVDPDGRNIAELPIESIQADTLAIDPAARRLYWSALTDTLGFQIHTAALDGTDQQQIVGQVQRARDIAVDPNSGHLYWTDSATGQIGTARHDGNGRQTLFDRRPDLGAIAVMPPVTETPEE